MLASIKQYQPVISEAFGAPRVVDLVKDVSLALDDKVPSALLTVTLAELMQTS